MDGTLSKDGMKWNAPSKRIKLEGPVVIRSADGSETTAAKVSLQAYPKRQVRLFGRDEDPLQGDLPAARRLPR